MFPTIESFNQITFYLASFLSTFQLDLFSAFSMVSFAHFLSRIGLLIAIKYQRKTQALDNLFYRLAAIC